MPHPHLLARAAATLGRRALRRRAGAPPAWAARVPLVTLALAALALSRAR